MKNVGIMTFHGADNYGAVLQAFALSEWLKKNGYSPEFIDYRSRAYEKYDLFRKNRYKRRPVFFIEDILNYTGNRKRKQNFDSFRKEHLAISASAYPRKETLADAADRYDYYICGSDQIWNPTLNRGLDSAFLLDFVKENEKKIAYAPSLGVDHLGYRDLTAIEEAIRTFHAVSVRETQGVELLQPYCTRKIHCVCDPVFLLEEEDYARLCKPADGKKYLFLYIVGSARKNRRIIDYAQKLAAQRQLRVVYLIDGNKTLFPVHGKNVFGCRVESFLSWIRNAEYVVSNSFHATAFSVIFRKPFMTFTKQGTSSRMYSLLTDLQLLDRIASGAPEDEDGIDFQHAGDRIAEMRRHAGLYLHAALEGEGKEREQMELAETEKEKALQAWKKLQDDAHAFDGKCFIAKNMDAAVRRDSRSGGVFTAVSDLILNQGGAVYGCRLETPDKAVHFRALTAEERDQMRGSKYIQSEMGDCYRQVREDLKRGIPVLFSGTPCQIAGLNAFLEKDDTRNLLTMDIVCHGVPSPAVWSSYLDWMSGKYHGRVEAAVFRDKRYGWKAHFESVRIQNRWHATAVFRELFNKNLILRPACYSCHFASLVRPGDITIGDAWGIERADPSWNDDQGISLVILNTEKGKQAFEAVRSVLKVQSVALEDYLQPNLRAPSERNSERETFWRVFSEKGFEQTLPKFAQSGKKRQIKDWIVLHGTRMHLKGLVRKLMK